MGHFTNRKRTSNAVVAFHLIEHLNAMTGKSHRWVMFDIEEVSRVQVLIPCRQQQVASQWFRQYECVVLP